jgi:glycosyltransferase involved in cell wall biosynthesis
MTNDNRITVVTTCFNNPVELRRTVKSVTKQSEKPARHIVVDSSSPAIASEMRAVAHGAGAEYVWTPPLGVYPAMNRALEEVASNHLVWFLNSSDSLAHPRSVSTISNFIKGHGLNGSEWMVGGLFRLSYSQIAVHKTGKNGKRFAKRMVIGAVGFPHPSTLISSKFLRESGGFNTRFDIAGDFDTGLRAVVNLGPPAMIDVPLTLHFPGGISYNRPIQNFLEKARARFDNFSFPRAIAVNLLALVYGVRGLIRRLSVLQEPEPPNHFMEKFNDSSFHFCGSSTGAWPSCCLSYLDAEEPEKTSR